MDLESGAGFLDSTIDEKGRVIIPAPMREAYKGKLVLTQGSRLCVWIILPEVWERFLDWHRKSAKEVGPVNFRRLQHLHYYPARYAEIDENSGRIPITSVVREYAGLVKDKMKDNKCYVIRASKHLEIWNCKYHNDYQNCKQEPNQIQDVSDEIWARFFEFGEEEFGNENLPAGKGEA